MVEESIKTCIDNKHFAMLETNETNGMLQSAISIFGKSKKTGKDRIAFYVWFATDKKYERKWLMATIDSIKSVHIMTEAKPTRSDSFPPEGKTPSQVLDLFSEIYSQVDFSNQKRSIFGKKK